MNFFIINVGTLNSVESFTQIGRNFTTHESHILEIMDHNLLLEEEISMKNVGSCSPILTNA